MQQNSVTWEKNGQKQQDTWTISSSRVATLGRLSLERIRMLARVLLLISVTMLPPLPIRHPIRELETNMRVVSTSPFPDSALSLHFGWSRTAASIDGERSSKYWKGDISNRVRAPGWYVSPSCKNWQGKIRSNERIVEPLLAVYRYEQMFSRPNIIYHCLVLSRKSFNKMKRSDQDQIN